MHSKRLKLVMVLLIAAVSMGLVFSTPLAAPQDDRPPMIHKFMVEIDGIVATGFENVFGLDSEIPVVEYRQGNSLTTMKIPGLVRYGNVVLRGPVDKNHELWQWYRQCAAGNVERHHMVVSILNANHEPVLRYKILNAWPCAWHGPELHATESGTAMEAIEFAIEGFERENE